MVLHGVQICVALLVLFVGSYAAGKGQYSVAAVLCHVWLSSVVGQSGSRAQLTGCRLQDTSTWLRCKGTQCCTLC
jgi:hypothetical protein